MKSVNQLQAEFNAATKTHSDLLLRVADMDNRYVPKESAVYKACDEAGNAAFAAGNALSQATPKK